MTAEEHLAEVKRLATARLKACKLAAAHEGLTLVDADRLERLEAVVTAIKVAVATAKMTRDYKDIQGPDEHYNGKRYLLRRDDFGVVLDLLRRLDSSTELPQGCFAEGRPR